MSQLHFSSCHAFCMLPYCVQCAQDLAQTLKHALITHEPLTDESPMPLLDDRHCLKTAHMPSKQADLSGLCGTSSVAICITTAA